jgi:hypothetical protein
MTETDKKILNLFVEKAEELKGCDLLKANHKLSFSIKVSGSQGVAKTSLPNEEQLRSFLLILRNFYSPREDIHFPKVCQILIDNLEDEDTKRRVSEVAAVYERILARSPISFVEENTPLTPNELLRRWLYGFYHHTDRKKRKNVEKWGFVAGLTKMQFVSTVFDLAKCVIWLSHVASGYVSGKVK